MWHIVTREEADTYVHRFPRAQQEHGASFAVHLAIWMDSQKHIQVAKDRVFLYATVEVAFPGPHVGLVSRFAFFEDSCKAVDTSAEL